RMWLRRLAALAVVATTEVAADREPAYRVLVRALALENSQAPEPRQKAVHERAKAALAKGRKPAALLTVNFYKAFLWPTRVGLGADAVHARRAALVVLSQIGPEAEDPPVHRLLKAIKVSRDDPTVIQAAKE